MKVTISVPGRFHAFYLAQQLLKRGYLDKLITSYPKFELAKYGIPKDKVCSVIIKELISRIWPQYPIQGIYDRWVEFVYTKSDICVAFAGFALETIRKAKKSGAVTVIERGSSHILYQERILEEEYGRLGLKAKPVHPKIIQKELKEYEEADYISIPSLFVKGTFLENGIPEHKLIHVPYGVDLSSFRQLPKEDKIFRIIYCGQISPRKGVYYLLKGFSELNLPDAELWLIGSIDGEMRSLLKQFNHPGIIYKGQYPQNELHKFYSQGSVFVIMSLEEGLAMVQLQAMACGLPVICSANTGGADIVEEERSGFIIGIRDTEALKEKLTFLYKNQETARQMGQAAKVRVSQNFTWDDYGRNMIDKYEKIIVKQ
jgi:glycosyltransferase involved in cell wall biosynthesis